MVWAHLAVVSALLCVIPFLLFAWAEQRVPSGLASIYNAATPLMTTLVALAALATVQVGLGAAIMLALTPFTPSAAINLTWPVIGSVAALGMFGTGLAYVWNTNVVAAWGATNASAVTYLTPVVGVALGVVVLGETVSWNEPLGAFIVIIGIAAEQGRFPALRPTTQPARTVSAPGADAGQQQDR
ncbi:EamA family transporter [Paenarthrobacter sp. Z7-10]|uniref:EamA family transporter n=1 Tax=Paenarthrobacter sp. Z7-10 TaxID=2787635 RepID=UPI0022A8D527|nr:DMT family transporter [Paenarthrobacter sp. Z7-10]